MIFTSEFIGGQPPAASASTAHVGAYLTTAGTRLLIAVALQMAAVPLMAWFIVSVGRRLSNGDSSPWPTVTVASTFLLAGIAAIEFITLGAVVYTDDLTTQLSDATLQLVWNLHNLLSAFSVAAVITTLMAFSISAGRGRTFPAWTIRLGWFAAAVSTLGAVAALGAQLGNFVIPAFIAFGLWGVATPIAMIRNPTA